LPNGAPDVLREKAKGVDATAFGYAFDLERHPELLNGSNVRVEIGSIIGAARHIDEPNPSVVAYGSIVGMAAKLLQDCYQVSTTVASHRDHTKFPWMTRLASWPANRTPRNIIAWRDGNTFRRAFL
jgi:hypothetical protein